MNPKTMKMKPQITSPRLLLVRMTAEQIKQEQNQPLKNRAKVRKGDKGETV